MSVFPGFGGQKFMPEVLAKTRGLREHGYSGRLEMDGGLNSETIARCAATRHHLRIADRMCER